MICCTKHHLRLKGLYASFMQIRQFYGLLRSPGNNCSWTGLPVSHCTCISQELFSRHSHSSRELFLTHSAGCAAEMKVTGNNRTCYMGVFHHSKQYCENKRLNCDKYDLSNSTSAINQAVSKCDTRLSDLQNRDRRQSLYDGEIWTSVIKLRCRAFQRYMSNGKRYMTLHGSHKCLLNQYSSVGSIPSQNQNCKHFHSSVRWSHNEWGMGVRTEPPWRVLFFGTDRISVETLKRLYDNM